MAEPAPVVVVKTWQCPAGPKHPEPVRVPRGQPCPSCGRALLEG